MWCRVCVMSCSMSWIGTCAAISHAYVVRRMRRMVNINENIKKTKWETWSRAVVRTSRNSSYVSAISRLMAVCWALD